MLNLSPVFTGQLLTNDGKPAAGHKVFVYQGGSFSTLSTSYSDSAGLVPNPNPVILDSAGRLAPIWLTVGLRYNLVLTRSDGTTVLQTFENVGVSAL